MSRNSYYTTGNLLEYLYHQNYYTLVGTDLSRQTNMTIPQQTSLTVKLGNNDATMSFITDKQQKNNLNLSLNSLILTELDKRY